MLIVGLFIAMQMVVLLSPLVVIAAINVIFGTQLDLSIMNWLAMWAILLVVRIVCRLTIIHPTAARQDEQYRDWVKLKRKFEKDHE